MTAKNLTAHLGGIWRNGHGQAPCPICQPERRVDQNALSISDSNGTLLLYCFKSNCQFQEILRAAGMSHFATSAHRMGEATHLKTELEYWSAQLAKAEDIWLSTEPIEGTMAEAYLRGRGISCDIPQTLRFWPDAYHGPTGNWSCAMVAKVEPTGGIHRTFFTKSGERVAKSPKMMLGPCVGGAVRLSQANGPLVVCEGIETGLSLLSGLLNGPANVWAALSTSGMKALELPKFPGELIIATDGDLAGRQAGNSLGNRACGLGWNVSFMAAPEGLDWNDALIKYPGAS